MHHTSHKLLHSVYHNIINFTTKFINAKQLLKNILFFIIIYISVPKVHFWYYEEKVITATSMNEIAKTAGYITKAVKCRCFYLSKFLSAVLSSIAVTLATAQSSALQIEIYSA